MRHLGCRRTHVDGKAAAECVSVDVVTLPHDVEAGVESSRLRFPHDQEAAALDLVDGRRALHEEKRAGRAELAAQARATAAEPLAPPAREGTDVGPHGNELTVRQPHDVGKVLATGGDSVDLKLGAQLASRAREPLGEHTGRVAILKLAVPGDEKTAADRRHLRPDLAAHGMVVRPKRHADSRPRACQSRSRDGVARGVEAALLPDDDEVPVIEPRQIGHPQIVAERSGLDAEIGAEPCSAAVEAGRPDHLGDVGIEETEVVEPGDPEAAAPVARHRRRRLVVQGGSVDPDLRAVGVSRRVEALSEDAVAVAVLVGALPDDDELAARSSGDAGPHLITGSVGVGAKLRSQRRDLRVEGGHVGEENDRRPQEMGRHPPHREAVGPFVRETHVRSHHSLRRPSYASPNERFERRLIRLTDDSHARRAPVN
jgi:hypothetical protein